jgi:hypothetical protein
VARALRLCDNTPKSTTGNKIVPFKTKRCVAALHYWQKLRTIEIAI